MKKITVEGIEINFNDLTEEKQKEIYENPVSFLMILYEKTDLLHSTF